MTRMHPGFAGVVQDEWPPAARAGRAPERLGALAITTLPGVGAALAKRLRALGHRDRRRPALARAAPLRAGGRRGRRSRSSWGDEEVAIAGGRERRAHAAARRPPVDRDCARPRRERRDLGASWFNQPWLAEKLTPGTHAAAARQARPVRLRRQELRRRRGAGDGRLRAGLSGERADAVDAAARARARRARAARPRTCPTRCRPSSSCRSAATRSLAVHFPADGGEAEEARRRLALDELFALQLAVARSRDDDAVASPLAAAGRARRALPRGAAVRADRAPGARRSREIDGDLARTVPMQRLLQGDVGSGKTVVALYALLRAVEHGRQGALMAPTETLAEQHFLTLEPLCGAARRPLRPADRLGAARRGCATRSQSGEAQIAVGTHALIQRDVEFADLAVAVVDEQHRFGVEQRQALAEGRAPARAAHDRDADPAHARADDLRRPRGERDREAAGEPQADRDGVGRRGALERGVRAAVRPPRRRPAGVSSSAR